VSLDKIRELGEELRHVLAQERAAIVALDHARLADAAAHKQYVAFALDEQRKALAPQDAAELRALFGALRAETRANAMLAAAAATAVRKLLGYEPTGGYDRHARRAYSQGGRKLAAY